MPDLTNRLPGRMLLLVAIHPLTAPEPCAGCAGAEQALAQVMHLLPPDLPQGVPLNEAVAAMYEAWLEEQRQGRFRVLPFQALGPHCLAHLAAQHMQQGTPPAAYQTYFAQQPLPDRLVGVQAVEPGVEGRAYPMLLGLSGALSLVQLHALINRPLGALDAGDELITVGTGE